MKIIRKKKLQKETLELVRNEIEILKTLQHPHIIKLYEVIETERVVFLILEQASGGEVREEKKNGKNHRN